MGAGEGNAAVYLTGFEDNAGSLTVALWCSSRGGSAPCELRKYLKGMTSLPLIKPPTFVWNAGFMRAIDLN